MKTLNYLIPINVPDLTAGQKSEHNESTIKNVKLFDLVKVKFNNPKFAIKMSKIYSNYQTKIGTNLHLFYNAMVTIMVFCAFSFQVLAQGPPSSSYTLTFEDNFDGTSIDRNKWNTTWINGGRTVSWSQEYMVDENVSVSGGSAHILQWFNPANTTCCGYRNESGVLTTYGTGKFHQQYGYYEARIKVAKGGGNLNAWWLSREESWPPEIDITEILSAKPTESVMTQHWGTVAADGSHPALGKYWLSGIDLTADYHIYAIEWNANEIIWYADGVERARQTNNVNNPLYLELNIHSGNSWAGYGDAYNTTKNYMDIDYVRVWQKGTCTVPSQAGAISGNTTVTDGSSQTYSVGAVSGATSYTWILPSGWTGSSTSNSITTTAASAGGTISVKANNACGSGTPATLTVNVGTTSTNLALNKSVTVSSTESATYPGSYAVDGNSSTRWASAYSDPQWIQVDLGASYNINRVKLTWEAAYGKDYQIQLSNDNTTWTTIKTVTGNTSLINDQTGLSGSGRYLRMFGTARGTVYGYSLYELEVYGTSTLPPSSFNGYYKISATHSGKALDVTGCIATDGTKVEQWSYWGGDCQQWKIESTGDGYYRLLSKLGLKALDVTSCGTANGTRVQILTSSGSDCQKFSITDLGGGDYKIINKNSGKALDVNGASTADGAIVQTWDYLGGSNQKWKLEYISGAARMGNVQMRKEGKKPASQELQDMVTAYPNPTSEQTTIAINLPTAGHTVINIFGSLGNKIAELQNGYLEPGLHQFEFNTSNLAPGILFYSVNFQGNVITKKLIKQ